MPSVDDSGTLPSYDFLLLASERPMSDRDPLENKLPLRDRSLRPASLTARDGDECVRLVSREEETNLLKPPPAAQGSDSLRKLRDPFPVSRGLGCRLYLSSKLLRSL